MQLVTESPGLRFVTLYRAEPASLSVMYTVPASKLLPVFEVLLLKAESVPTPTMAPTTPTISRLSVRRRALLSLRSFISCSFPWALGPLPGRVPRPSCGHGPSRQGGARVVTPPVPPPSTG